MSARVLAERLAAYLARGGDPVALLNARGHSEAAGALASGAPLAEAVVQGGALPRRLARCFEPPRAAEALLDVVRREAELQERFVGTGRLCLAAFALVYAAVAIGTLYAVPVLELWFAETGVTAGGAWGLRGLLYELTQPLVLWVAGAAGLALALLLPRLYSVSAIGRSAGRASQCRRTHARLRAGASLARALEASGLPTAAARIEGGAPAAEVLAQTPLAPRGCAGLWALLSQPGADAERLDTLLAGFVDAHEATLASRAPTAERRIWLAYALLGGALVGLFAAVLVSGWLGLVQL